MSTIWTILFRGLGATAFLTVVAFGGAYARSSVRIAQTYAVTTPDLVVPQDDAAIAAGRHLITLAKCAECHADDLGGKVILDSAVVARIAGSNLTTGEGGVGALRTDADLLRALRHGVGVDGRGLLGMPTVDHAHFTDEELVDIVAAIRAAPPVQRTLPPNTVGPVFRVMHAFDAIELIGAEKVDHGAPPQGPVNAADPMDFGRHLTAIGGCYSCHGPGLSGGKMAGAPPDYPPASNITPDPTTGIGAWTEADFRHAMHDGLRPNGTLINPAMPWRYTRAMTEQEIDALWTFLRTVEPRPYGGA